MTDSQRNISDVASEKLLSEVQRIKDKTYSGNQQKQVAILCEAVGHMLVNFCCQSEDFAAAVAERMESGAANLWAFCEGIVREHWATGYSDVNTYADAVKYYMPGATVRATFRVDAPREVDDDLFSLDLGYEPTAPSANREDTPAHTAIILDLFDPGEISPPGELSPDGEV